MANKIDLTSIATAFYKLDDDLATQVILDDTGQNDAATTSDNTEDLHSDLSKTGTGAIELTAVSGFMLLPQSIITGAEFSMAFWANDEEDFVRSNGKLLAGSINQSEIFMSRTGPAETGDWLFFRIGGVQTSNLEGLPRGVWNFYVLSSEPDGFGRLYINGELVLTTPTITPFNGLTGALELGNSSLIGTRNFEGRFDGVMTFDRSLDSSERSALYANGRGVDSLIMDPAGIFPVDRPPTYDPDKVWDEETGLWYEPDTAIGAENLSRGSGRFGNKLVAVSDEGSVYFEDY